MHDLAERLPELDLVDGLDDDVTLFAPTARASLRGRIGWYLAWTWLAVIVGAALFADLLPLWSPDSPDFDSVNSWISRDHPLGADGLGRDNLARIVFGSRASLLVGLAAVLLGMVVGGLLGLVAAYRGGALERVIMVITDAVLAFPGLVLLLAIVAVLGASLPNLIAGLAIGAVPTFVRLTRANTLVISRREYVLAARGYGSRPWRVMLREIAPNVVLPVAAYGFIMIGVFIVVEGSLSFLGLGIPPPTPSWGSMIASGRQKLTEEPHVSLIPAFVLFITVMAINYIGERVRKRFEVRESNL